MMTYYEELGVPAGASREEIRQAYKRLVRLLHPDRCGDPATRVLAELQMRRLNGILDVLSRQDERANYDRSLAHGEPVWPAPDAAARPEPPNWDGLWCNARSQHPQPADREVEGSGARMRARREWFPPGSQPQPVAGATRWPGPPWRWSAVWRFTAALACVAGLVFFRALLPSSPPVPRPVTPAAATLRRIPPPGVARTTRASSSRAAARQQEDRPTDVFAGDSPAARYPLVEEPSPVILEPAAIRAAMPAPVAGDGGQPPGKEPDALSGDWIFVPPAVTTKSGYPPEYIELRLREHEGVMRGSYRARYRVHDRAISPNVAFQFEGPTGAEGGVLPWRGPAGSQGEVTLRLLATGTLEVTWEADRLGEELGLISGDATLVRKLD